jgi:hypothetical protein
MSDEASIIRTLLEKKLAAVCANVVRHELATSQSSLNQASTGIDKGSDQSLGGVLVHGY